MFYHVRVGVTGITSWLEINLPRDKVLEQWLCPFVARELTFNYGRLYNMATFGSLSVFQTDQVIDSEWPINKQDFKDKEGATDTWKYERELEAKLPTIAKDVTQELTQETFVLLDSGKWKERTRKAFEREKGKYCFFICPFGNDEVDHNYKFVIGPTVKQHGFEIQRVDEVSHSKTITEVILTSIARSRFVVADLTDIRPNCYYELGYAHALGKPVILLAKDGTERHFDISTYQWNYWKNYEDLQPVFDRAVSAVLSELGLLRNTV